MRKAFMTLTVVAVLGGAAPALGQAVELVIDLDVTIFGDAGEVIKVAEIAVDSALVGTTCDAIARTANNASEWDDNDLIISSGGTSTVIRDFEAVAGGVTVTEGTLDLGDAVILSIRLGPRGISSAGLWLVLTCDPAPAPTTTTTTTTTAAAAATTTTTTTTTTATTTTTTTTQPPARGTPVPTTTKPAPGVTTTTELPPVGAVAAGGGGEATAVGGESEASRSAVAWTIAGFLALLAALTLAVAGKRRISSPD